MASSSNFCTILSLLVVFGTAIASKSKDSFAVPMSFDKDSKAAQTGADGSEPDMGAMEDPIVAQSNEDPQFTVWSSGAEGAGVMEDDIPDVEDTVTVRSEPKREWPELVGLTGEAAKAAVEQEIRGLSVFIVPHNSFVTMDFRMDRLRVYVDEKGLVSSVPRIG